MRTGEPITHEKHRWRKVGVGGDKINKYGRANTGRRGVRRRRRSGAEGGISSVETRGTRT